MSEESKGGAAERVAAAASDFDALIRERAKAPGVLAELLVGAAMALHAVCEAQVYVVPLSATRYALAVRGREVITVVLCGPALYDIIALDRRPVTVSQKALGDAILEALPIFVHAAFAGGPEAS